MKTKKDTRITLRLTPDQYESIKARANTAQMAVGTYACLAESPHGGAVSPCAGAVPAGGYTSDVGADCGAGAGSDSDPEPARTGWEKERAAFFASTAQAAPTPPVPGAAAHSSNSAGALGSVVELGHALERNQDAAPVMDATAIPTHHERGKKRKLAPGQKADDHEVEEQTMQMRM